MLTTRKQRVVVDGEVSAMVQMDFGVAQGTVFCLLMLLLLINDIVDYMDSSIMSFTNDFYFFGGYRRHYQISDGF